MRPLILNVIRQFHAWSVMLRRSFLKLQVFVPFSVRISKRQNLYRFMVFKCFHQENICRQQFSCSTFGVILCGDAYISCIDCSASLCERRNVTKFCRYCSFCCVLTRRNAQRCQNNEHKCCLKAHCQRCWRWRKVMRSRKDTRNWMPSRKKSPQRNWSFPSVFPLSNTEFDWSL